MIRAILAKIGKKIDGNWQMEHILAYTYVHFNSYVVLQQNPSRYVQNSNPLSLCDMMRKL